MQQYLITLTSGAQQTVNGDDYMATNSGLLVIKSNDLIVAMFSASCWVSIVTMTNLVN